MPQVEETTDQTTKFPERSARPTASSSHDVEAKNFALIALHQITMRTGWIFKTESIVMPAVLDLIGGSGWLRGLLPMLSRLGQSVPPLLASNWLVQSRVKKHWLAISSVVMGLLFLLLSWLWRFVDSRPPAWLPLAFLIIYALFFVTIGINQLALGTIHGKLVDTFRRGRLMLIANSVGALIAIFCAWYLLRQWLQPQGGNFVAIFGVAGAMFIGAGVISWWLVETPDDFEVESEQPSNVIRLALAALKNDRPLFLLTLVGGCFGMSLTLFPHYQALALQRLDLDLTWLIPWLIAQNIGVGMLSIPAGWMADRFGNLLVLRLFLGLLCIVPMLALLMSGWGITGARWFFCVFAMLGVTPITMRVFKNYSLELTSRENQPLYLGIMAMCMAIPPILTSSLVGLMVDVTGFHAAFWLVNVCLIVGWLLTWTLRDPRQNGGIVYNRGV